MKQKTELQKSILSLLGNGKENIRQSSYFTGMLKINRRAFRAEINELRNDIPIVSRDTAPCGYYIAETSEELEEFIESLKHTVRGYQSLISIMEKHLENLDED